MIDPLISQTGAAAELGAGQPASVGTGPASQDDVARFQEALHPDADIPQQVGNVVPAGGNAPLEGLDKLSADLQTAKNTIIEGTRNMGEVGDLLRMQFEVANLTTTQTMVGQVGQKTSQGTQQLLKGQ